MDELTPTMLGAVAGTMTPDADVLTGSTCGCSACDGCTDYARTSALEHRGPAAESR
jgi:hypothetical protein